jgi:hypothetical protein
MICSRCKTDTVTWRGPMASLTHAECSKCGGTNCQQVEPPSDDECPNCGGDGVTYDCIDGMCVDSESGCDLCERKCDWCGGKG